MENDGPIGTKGAPQANMREQRIRDLTSRAGDANAIRGLRRHCERLATMFTSVARMEGFEFGSIEHGEKTVSS